jgi:hypothetical protein
MFLRRNSPLSSGQLIASFCPIGIHGSPSSVAKYEPAVVTHCTVNPVLSKVVSNIFPKALQTISREKCSPSSGTQHRSPLSRHRWVGGTFKRNAAVPEKTDAVVEGLYQLRQSSWANCLVVYRQITIMVGPGASPIDLDTSQSLKNPRGIHPT